VERVVECGQGRRDPLLIQRFVAEIALEVSPLRLLTGDGGAGDERHAGGFRRGVAGLLGAEERGGLCVADGDEPGHGGPPAGLGQGQPIELAAAGEEVA
jgi:hypothetical protein